MGVKNRQPRPTWGASNTAVSLCAAAYRGRWAEVVNPLAFRATPTSRGGRGGSDRMI
jgi:hypothetical protein